MDKNIVTQTLVSIQGEGKGVGKPILLIRFGGCQLACSMCDSSWTNKDIYCSEFSETNCKTPFKVERQSINNFVNYIQYKFLDKYEIETVLFTGGETFLNVELMALFIDSCSTMNYFKTYEIETNGLLLYDNMDFLNTYKDVIQLNISPKPQYYYDMYDERFKKVLKYISEDVFSNSYKIKDSFLKFVYHPDFQEKILSFIKKFNPQLPIYMSSFTPQHGSENFLEHYRLSCLETLDFCLQTGYRYSPREHVFLFGENREEFDSLA